MDIKLLEEDIILDVEVLAKYIKVVDISKYKNENGIGQIKVIN